MKEADVYSVDLLGRDLVAFSSSQGIQSKRLLHIKHSFSFVFSFFSSTASFPVHGWMPPSPARLSLSSVDETTEGPERTSGCRAGDEHQWMVSHKRSSFIKVPSGYTMIFLGKKGLVSFWIQQKFRYMTCDFWKYLK